MQWMNPAGAWAFIALAVIVCLYILKQKMEPVEISSTYLWRKALQSLEADHPFQKLRRNLLFFLQLLLALLLVLSLMRPATPGGEAGELLFVFDLSASMQADDGNGSRLESAVSDARKRVDGLPDGARVSILTAGAQVSQPVARTADTITVKRALDALKAENGGADLDGALSLAYALARELTDAQIIVYSDQPVDNADVIQPQVGPGLSNLAILSLNASGTVAVARIANYGAQTEVTLECYADDVLCDLRTLTLQEDEITSVRFDLPENALVAQARIAGQDALAADNVRFWVSRKSSGTTIVFAGRDNVFLEKALSLRADVTLLRTTAEEAAAVSGGALTVLDGPLPDTMPERSALLLIDPDAYIGEHHDTPVTLTAASGALANTLNEYLQVEQIQVSAWNTVPYGTPVWLAGGEPVLTILEEDGRRIVILGFDLHQSNLPLLKEFPIWVQRLLDFLVPEPLGAGFTDADCGSVISITPQTFARDAAVLTPSGRRIPISLGGTAFADTNEIGVYHLLQTDENGDETSVPFVLHIPAAESDVRTAAQGLSTENAASGGSSYGREWTPWLIGLLLVITILEWWVYRHGY